MQMTLNFYFLSIPLTFTLTLLSFVTLYNIISSWMPANLLTLNTSKTEFLLIRLKQQLANFTTARSKPTTHFTRLLA